MLLVILYRVKSFDPNQLNRIVSSEKEENKEEEEEELLEEEVDQVEKQSGATVKDSISDRKYSAQIIIESNCARK